MKKKNILWATLVLSIMGTLFAGYLTFTKFVLGYCPLTEPCPYLWGYPVCVYGLIMFVTLFFASLVLLTKSDDVLAKNLLVYVSALGILFSAYYVYQEIFASTCLGPCKYSLGIPSCVYGFIMYILIFVCALMFRKK